MNSDTHSLVTSNPPTTLSWRIPTGGDPRILRLALAQIGLASVVAALVLLVAAPRDWLGLGLAGLVPLAVIMAYRLWHRHQQSLFGPDNVRIDGAGVHWIDGSGKERTIARKDVDGFRLGREEDTVRQVPALTLYLTGGFESQPIELHSPVTEGAIRELLSGLWQIEERPVGSGLPYDRTFHVYSECHDEHQEWHWEGTGTELAALFAMFQQAADELPAPPPGAKPAQWIILAQRREPARIRVQHAPSPHLEHGLIGGPATLLREISERARWTLEALTTPGDGKFDISLRHREAWTFHLHVREL